MLCKHLTCGVLKGYPQQTKEHYQLGKTTNGLPHTEIESILKKNCCKAAGLGRGTCGRDQV